MKKPTKADCAGCRDDVYNRQNYGLNRQPDGSFECWSLKSATLVSKIDVPLSMAPPYDALKPTTRPSCFRASGIVRMDPPRKR